MTAITFVLPLFHTDSTFLAYATFHSILLFIDYNYSLSYSIAFLILYFFSAYYAVFIMESGVI